MFRLVVFDLDGTLLDSAEAILKSINVTFAKLGLGPYDWEKDIVRFFGKPFELWAETLLREAGKYSRENFEKMTNGTWKAYEEIGYREAKLNEGAEKLLEDLKDMGVRMAVATNMRIQHARKFLPHLGIDKYFEAVCTVSDVKKGKPWPEQMECVLEKVKTRKEEVLMVGDTKLDVDFSRNSGVKVAIIEMPWNKGVKSDYRVKKLAGILKIVKGSR